MGTCSTRTVKREPTFKAITVETLLTNRYYVVHSLPFHHTSIHKMLPWLVAPVILERTRDTCRRALRLTAINQPAPRGALMENQPGSKSYAVMCTVPLTYSLPPDYQSLRI